MVGLIVLSRGMDGHSILAVSNFNYALSFCLWLDTNPNLKRHILT